MKDRLLTAYFMRVNRETGVPYKGYLGTIENTLAAKQKYVNFDETGGWIQIVHLGNDIVVVCHDEGKILAFPPNRALLDDNGEVLDVFCGNILILRRMGEELISISEADIPYIKKILRPVILLNGGIMMQATDEELPEYRGM